MVELLEVVSKVPAARTHHALVQLLAPRVVPRLARHSLRGHQNCPEHIRLRHPPAKGRILMKEPRLLMDRAMIQLLLMRRTQSPVASVP
jgi:hypothetical protein